MVAMKRMHTGKGEFGGKMGRADNSLPCPVLAEIFPTLNLFQGATLLFPTPVARMVEW